jgi:hypothetical protein
MTDKDSAEPGKIKEILSVVSDKVPALIKGLVGSVFSEEAGRGMGKAAAAFYAELKAGGIPEETALEMTRDYIRNFTNLSDIFKNIKS